MGKIQFHRKVENDSKHKRIKPFHNELTTKIICFMKLKQFEKRTEKHRKVQANKSIRRMPWHREPKKDVTSCDKPRGAANKLRSADFRMGKPL